MKRKSATDISSEKEPSESDSPKRSKAKLPVWHQLQLRTADELRLDLSLPSGQSFRWSKYTVDEREAWCGVIKRTAFFLHQPQDDPSTLLFRYLSEGDVQPKDDEEEVQEKRQMLQDYFQLGMSMDDAWGRWTAERKKESKVIAHFKDSCLRFRGLRTLRTDPVECLISCICTQNNNIARITQMVNALCARYGDKIGTKIVHNGQKEERKVFHAFPSLETLAEVPEKVLRDMSFGYRAKYIPAAAKQVLEMEDEELGNGQDWLYALRSKSVSRERAQKELTSLMGVGKKVADCVCLFSLDKLDAVPVDTHVRQIAQRFMPSLKKKANGSMNDALYTEISTFFKTQFGEDCGWAHSLLFAAELTMFKQKAETTTKGQKKKKGKQIKDESSDEESEVKQEEENEEKETGSEAMVAVKREKREREEETVTMTTRRRSSRLSRGKLELTNEKEDQEMRAEEEEKPVTARRKKRRSTDA